MKDHTELFKQFSDDESFWRWLTDTIFNITYDQPNTWADWAAFRNMECGMRGSERQREVEKLDE
jgi:hypothetical protein